MKYSDILKQANLHAGLDIEASVGLWYINDGIAVLATTYDTACTRGSATVTASTGVWVDLPTDTIRVVECKVNGQDYDFYEASLGQIRFEGDVTAELTLLYPPARLVGDTDPALHSLYHLPLALYIAARARQTMFADEEQDAMRLMGEFFAETGRVNTRLSGLKGTRKVMRAVMFR